MIVVAIPQYHLLQASIVTDKSTQFVAHKSASALKGFPRHFQIESVKDPSDPSPGGPGPEGAGRGVVGFGWKEFMEKVKPEVSRIIRDNRLTKIKIILSCEIVRENENGSGQL